MIHHKSNALGLARTSHGGICCDTLPDVDATTGETVQKLLEQIAKDKLHLISSTVESETFVISLQRLTKNVADLRVGMSDAILLPDGTVLTGRYDAPYDIAKWLCFEKLESVTNKESNHMISTAPMRAIKSKGKTNDKAGISNNR